MLASYQLATGTAFVNDVVLCETVWTLRTGYRLSRERIAEVLEDVVETALFVFEDRNLLREALRAYRAGSGDFSDYLFTGRWPDGLRNWVVTGLRVNLRLQAYAYLLLVTARYPSSSPALEPPPRPRVATKPSVAVVGTGKRTGKTAVAGHLAEVLARGERLAGAGDDHCADTRVVEQLAQRVTALEPHLLVEGVALPGSVPRDDGDAGVVLDEDGLSGHASR